MGCGNSSSSKVCMSEHLILNRNTIRFFIIIIIWLGGIHMPNGNAILMIIRQKHYKYFVCILVHEKSQSENRFWSA
jgi:hypothetical protein